MSKVAATVQKSVQGFGYKSSSCENTRLICWELNGKNYIVEVDSCGNQVSEPKPLGRCSVDAEGNQFPLDENGNQVITIDINEIDMDINSVVQEGAVITFTAEDGSSVSVDVCAIVAQNCNATLTVNQDGSVLHIDNAGVETTIPAPAPETVTSLTNTDVGVYVHQNEDGDETTIDVCADVAAGCSDTLVLNPDGSVTHTAVNGDVEVIPAPTVSALAVAGSAVTHTSGNGTEVSFDICAIVAANCNSPMTLNADGSVDYLDNAGVPTTIPAPTNSSVVTDLALGTITHTTGSGVETVIDVCALAQICAPSLVAGPGVNEYTFNNGYGVTQVINVNEVDMDINAMSVAGSVLNWTSEDGTSGNVDICAVVAANCNSPMILNADGSVSYTDNAGVTTVIPAHVRSSLTDNGDGTSTHDDGAGNTTDVQNPLVDSASNQIAADGVTLNPLLDCDGNAIDFEIDTVVKKAIDQDGNAYPTDGNGNQVIDTSHTDSTIADNGNGTATITASDGTEKTDAVCGQQSTVVDNGDGTSTVTQNDGTFDTYCNDPVKSVTGAGVDDTDPQNPTVGTNATIVNADGSVTHTALDGTTETVPAPIASVLTDNADNTLTHNAGDGSDPVVVNTGDVTDNFNGTMTVTDKEGDACTAPTSIPVKCDDSNYAKGETYKALTQEQGHAPSVVSTAVGLSGVDAACAPPLPTCPIDGTITVDEKGITWQIISGIYQPVAFTPACKLSREVLGQIVLNDAALSANGNTVQNIGSVCVEISNDDCVPMKVEGRLRGFMLSQLSPGVRIIVSYVFDQANSSEIEFTDGTPVYTVDTRREGAGIQNDSEGTQIIGFESSDLLLPGETATACFNVSVRVQNYVATASNIVTLQSTIATMSGERCIDL